MNTTGLKVKQTLDCSWLLCPAPILMAEENIQGMLSGSVLEVIFTDPGAKPDLMAWCRASGNDFLGCVDEKAKSKAYIGKGSQLKT